MAIHRLSRTVSSLAVRAAKFGLSLRSVRFNGWRWLGSAAILAFSVVGVQAFQGYNVVITTDQPTENQFLSVTTNTFHSQLTANPFFTGTYNINLYPPAPAFQPVQVNTIGESLVQIGTATETVYQSTYSIDNIYYLGYVTGQYNERQNDLGLVDNAGVSCSTDTACDEAINSTYDAIDQQSLSTPTVITAPGF